jgi:hypothetical protein
MNRVYKSIAGITVERQYPPRGYTPTKGQQLFQMHVTGEYNATRYDVAESVPKCQLRPIMIIN